MNKPMVLCYNLSGPRAELVRNLAKTAGIEPFLVPKEAHAQKIGALCGLFDPTDEAYTGEGFAEEMMLMAHLEKGMLSRFLDGFREIGIPSIPLKAMLTQNNSQWDSIHLHGELMQEFLYFQSAQKAAKKK